MAKLSDAQIVTTASLAGFSGKGLQLAVAIALAESGGVTDAKGYNRNASGQILSIDRGLWQINNVFHPEVSDSCAYDATCNARAAYTISKKGSTFTPWSTYNNGAYNQFIARANNAIAATGKGINANPGPGTNPSAPALGSAGGSTLAATNPLDFQQVSQADVFSSSSVVEGSGDNNSAYKLILALLIMFAFIYAISKTRAGYAAIYYAQCLILLFLFATQSTFFKESLLPLANLTQPQGDAGNTTGNNNTLASPVTPASQPPVRRGVLPL